MRNFAVEGLIAGIMSRVVPWMDTEDWSQVHIWLYSEDENMQQLGVDRVCMSVCIYIYIYMYMPSFY